MRTFTLHRSSDETGVSGTGTVLEGVEFSDGSVVLCWTSEPRSHVLWDSFDDFYKVHVASHPKNGSVVTFSDGEELVQPPAEDASEMNLPYDITLPSLNEVKLWRAS